MNIPILPFSTQQYCKSDCEYEENDSQRNGYPYPNQYLGVLAGWSPHCADGHCIIKMRTSSDPTGEMYVLLLLNCYLRLYQKMIIINTPLQVYVTTANLLPQKQSDHQTTL